MAARHARDRLTHSRGTRLTNGNALIASLATSALEKGIPISLSTNVRLLTTKDGHVTGAIIGRDGRSQTIITKRGVVLASGGFPANEDLRRPFDAKIRNGRFGPESTSMGWPPRSTSIIRQLALAGILNSAEAPTHFSECTVRRTSAD
jgi:hypothetical protein